MNVEQAGMIATERYRPEATGIAFELLMRDNGLADNLSELDRKVKSAYIRQEQGRFKMDAAKMADVYRVTAKRAAELLTSEEVAAKLADAAEAAQNGSELVVSIVASIGQPVAKLLADGHTVREIVRATGIPRGTIQNRIYAARKKLANC